MLEKLIKNKEIILASGSPRRQKFFQELGIPVSIDVRSVEEIFSEDLQAEEITNYLAKLKATAFEGQLLENQILITSDTIVYLEGKAMGKPKDHAEAVKMIGLLSGKQHDVITSVCFTTSNSQKCVFDKTRVYFKEVNQEEIEYYVTNFQPFDKAGGYAIQEWIGLIAIEKIEGSYFNVVGLPSHLVYATLQEILKG